MNRRAVRFPESGIDDDAVLSDITAIKSKDAARENVEGIIPDVFDKLYSV